MACLLACLLALFALLCAPERANTRVCLRLKGNNPPGEGKAICDPSVAAWLRCSVGLKSELAFGDFGWLDGGNSNAFARGVDAAFEAFANTLALADMQLGMYPVDPLLLMLTLPALDWVWGKGTGCNHSFSIPFHSIPLHSTPLHSILIGLL